MPQTVLASAPQLANQMAILLAVVCTSERRVMPGILAIALGGVVFSLLLSIALVIRHSRRQQTEYEKWLEEANKNNIVKNRNQISEWRRIRFVEASK